MIDHLKQILGQYQRRTLLIALAVILLLLNGGRMAVTYYNESQHAIADKILLLAQHRASVQTLDQLQARVEILRRQQQRLNRYFVPGKSEEEILSTIQIKLQEMVSRAAMNPEFIRPVRRGGGAKNDDFGEISVNVRMSGTLNNFTVFLKNLYMSQYFFKIESFAIKPFKQDMVQIVLEVKGFHKGALKN